MKNPFQSKFKSNSKTLDDILSCQRSPNNKTELGYDNGKKTEQSCFINKRSYVDALMRPVVKEYNKNMALSQNKSKTDNLPSIHKQLVLGNCYTCNNFGHKAIDCRTERKVSEYKKKS